MSKIISLKSAFRFSIVLVAALVAVSLVLPIFAQADDQLMNMPAGIDDHMMPDGSSMSLSGVGYTPTMGPYVSGQMLHVYIDVVMFVIAMWLVVKIGSGKIRYPIMMFGFAFLLSSLVPVIWGHKFMWLMALSKSALAFISLLMFVSVFGGRALLFPKNNENNSA